MRHYIRITEDPLNPAECASLDALIARGIHDGVVQVFAQLNSKGYVLPVRQQWLRVRAAAAYLGIDIVTMAKWRQACVGPPFHRVGTRVYYDIDILDAFVRSDGASLGGFKR